jgi:hypothetical protein
MANVILRKYIILVALSKDVCYIPFLVNSHGSCKLKLANTGTILLFDTNIDFIINFNDWTKNETLRGVITVHLCETPLFLGSLERYQLSLNFAHNFFSFQLPLKS